MEIYVNSTAAERTVLLEFPVMQNASVDAYAYVDGEEVFEFTTLTAATDESGYNAVIPLFLVQFDSVIEIHWSVSYLEVADGETYTVNRVTPVHVVTPILSKREVREIDDVVFASDAEYVKIEKAVRHIINSYTGQEFGHFIGTLEAPGTGGTAITTPRRLLEITKLNGQAINSAHVSIESDGYILRHYPWGVPPVKADYHGLHQHVGGVIHNPNNVSLATFKSSRTYKITGRWGWETCPAPVKEAAKLLVNDYACADAQYRDRYLVSMTAADWRIQFNSGAYMRTGNVRADQLLADFVVTRGWGII